MLRHIVIFKLKDGIARDDSRVVEVFDMLLRLPARIPEIRAWELGFNVTKRDIAYDMALVSSFEDPDALQRYSDHPAHREVVDRLREICTWRICDFFPRSL